MKHPRFFTWVTESYNSRNDVPRRLRAHMRVLWLEGASITSIAEGFELPYEWVDDFVREEAAHATTH
jgi:hypothetical protein